MEQGVNLLANFPFSSPFFPHYRNMRTSSKTHLFRWKACSKNNSLREWVDSRVQHIWRLQVTAPALTSTPHRSHIDPHSTFISAQLHQQQSYIPPPPHFHCFLSITTITSCSTSFFLFLYQTSYLEGQTGQTMAKRRPEKPESGQNSQNRAN